MLFIAEPNFLLYVWPELTTPKFGGAYSQQLPVRFSFRKLRGVLQCLNGSTQVSELKLHQWLLRISTAQFLHAKFGEIFENKITNNLRVTPTEPPNL
jgi:membrane associated rhomboid family serine protease